MQGFEQGGREQLTVWPSSFAQKRAMLAAAALRTSTSWSAESRARKGPTWSRRGRVGCMAAASSTKCFAFFTRIELDGDKRR